MLTCSTGKEDNDGKCFAQCLANELGVEVEAPNDIIHAFSDGRYTIGLGSYDNTGKMKKFKPEVIHEKNK